MPMEVPCRLKRKSKKVIAPHILMASPFHRTNVTIIKDKIDLAYTTMLGF